MDRLYTLYTVYQRHSGKFGLLFSVTTLGSFLPIPFCLESTAVLASLFSVGGISLIFMLVSFRLYIKREDDRFQQLRHQHSASSISDADSTTVMLVNDYKTVKDELTLILDIMKNEKQRLQAAKKDVNRLLDPYDNKANANKESSDDKSDPLSAQLGQSQQHYSLCQQIISDFSAACKNLKEVYTNEDDDQHSLLEIQRIKNEMATAADALMNASDEYVNLKSKFTRIWQEACGDDVPPEKSVPPPKPNYGAISSNNDG